MVPEKLKNLSILLAEDNAINRLIGTTMLQRWGFTVKQANDGAEAVKLLQEEHFDLILMDIQMPEMDGVEATEAIRALADPTKSGIPIIALTASALEGEEEKFLEAGMNGYVTKPFKDTILFDAIEKALA